MTYPTLKTLSLLLECLNCPHPLKLNYSVVVYLRHSKKERRTAKKYIVCKWIVKRQKIDHKVVKTNILAHRLETFRITEVVDYLESEYRLSKKGGKPG